jgi:dethiobiotin synthetase
MPCVHGITIVGSGIDSGELRVAAACAAAGATPVALYALGPEAERHAQAAGVTEVLATAAAPVIAARHAGAQLDPAALVADAHSHGDHLIAIAAPGGFLASITEHYSVRDLARELGLPVVIAANATGGVTGHVRLVAEAARAAGLAVAAVVLTGWPEPPNRVQLDERELLSRLVKAPVVTLGDAETPDWAVADWAAAAAPEPAEPDGDRGPAAAAPVLLDDYDAWTPRQVGDPRGTPRPQIMQAMLDIIEAEGPMTATRAYSLYNRASGGRKLTSVAKAPLSSAVYWLAREGKLTLTREADIPWQGDDMVRLPDQPAVRVRELGPRTLDEVPLDEIAELIKLIRVGRGMTDPAELKRAVLSTYGLVRLTTRADEYLGLAIDLAA